MEGLNPAGNTWHFMYSEARSVLHRGKRQFFIGTNPTQGKKKSVPRAKRASPDFDLKLRVSRTHLGWVSIARTPTEVTPRVWKDPTVLTDGWEGWGELASTGMSALGKH